MERWKARLNVAADAAEPEQLAGEEPQAAAAEPAEAEQPAAEEAPSAGEYRFLGQQEQQQAGDAQALAPATEEQAAAQTAQQQGQDEEPAGAGDADVAAAAEGEGEEEAMDTDQQPPGEQQQLVSGTANWGAGGDRKAGLEAGGAEQEAEEQPASPGAEEEAQQSEGDGAAEGEREAEAAAADESYVAARLQAASLEDGGAPLAEQVLLEGLSEEAAAALRQQLDARLRAASEGSAPMADSATEAHGREVWTRCEALTAGGPLGRGLRLSGWGVAGLQPLLCVAAMPVQHAG